jgi:hypothetical protein
MNQEKVFIPHYKIENDGIHLLDENKIQQFDQDVKDVLIKGHILSFEHVKPTNEFVNILPRKIDINKGLPYHRRQNTFKRALHWGQLKLFLSEVEFLISVLEDNKAKKQIVMVYAGAAPGYHIAYLQKLFPMVIFELYDPNDFAIEDNNLLHTHVQFFTDIDAEYWHVRALKENLYLAFCSDIRTEPATQENIIRNMNMQMKWWQIMNPDLSMFKFRLPWEEGKTIYPIGEIYAQAYPGPTSTETRLIVKKDAVLKDYDNKQYESACFYHNSVVREKKYNCKLGKLNLERDNLDNCYDCVSFIIIMEKYLKITGRKITLLRQIIAEVQSEISFHKSNIKIKTINYYNKTFDIFKKLCYLACSDKNCKVCINGNKEINCIARGFSKATIINEEEAIKKMILIRKNIDDA